MAFYTPSWLRKVIKEDAKYIADYVSKKDNDFRGYVDAKFPFVLWLEMGEIAEKVLKPNLQLLDNTINISFPPEQRAWARQTLEIVLLNAYKAVINKYIDNSRYKEVSYDELEELLKPLSTLPLGEVRPYLNKVFKNTLRVKGSVSTKNKSVMLISPSFTAIKFGKDFRDSIDLSPFGQDQELELDESTGEYVQTAYSKIKEILYDVSGKISGKKQDFFTQLQNVGHIEVDVVSEVDKKVKRGQVSPRFLQALVSVPNQPRVISKLQADFSKETKQAQTRVLVRKRLSSKKLVFEMLVEYGLPVGIPESQVTNLQKATQELKFGPGAGLTAQIRKNPSLLLDLETSKSVKQYLEQNLKSILQSNIELPEYTSNYTNTSSVSYTVTRIKPKNLDRKSASAQSKKLTKAPSMSKKQVKEAISLISIINSALQEQVRKNMGTGNRRDVLNYRTGRFASSVKVERISESRQGMLTAFYSYMKYPYATFSKGGRQQFPASRDPKLLISKSIREIASTIVSNQLRAVAL